MSVTSKVWVYIIKRYRMLGLKLNLVFLGYTHYNLE